MLAERGRGSAAVQFEQVLPSPESRCPSAPWDLKEKVNQESGLHISVPNPLPLHRPCLET